MKHASNEVQAKRAAEKFREEHGLGDQPLGDLVGVVERFTGYDVAIIDAGADEHGLTMFDPARQHVLIGVARTPHPMRQRSTLAHELGHVIFEDHSSAPSDGPSKGVGKRTPEEIRADAFARHLLIPQAGLKAWLGSDVSATEAILSSVVQRYLVSPAIAAIAMRDAGYISAEVATEWKAKSTRYLATAFGWSDYYASLQDDANRVRAPQKLLARAVRGYIEGVVSPQTLATLRGISVEELLNEFAKVGLEPKEYSQEEFEANELPKISVDLSEL